MRLPGYAAGDDSSYSIVEVRATAHASAFRYLHSSRPSRHVGGKLLVRLGVDQRDAGIAVAKADPSGFDPKLGTQLGPPRVPQLVRCPAGNQIRLAPFLGGGSGFRLVRTLDS